MYDGYNTYVTAESNNDTLTHTYIPINVCIVLQEL